MPISRELKKNKSSIYTTEADVITDNIENYIIRRLHVPELIIGDLAQEERINTVNFNDLNNEQLEEYLSFYGSYKSYLEYQLSKAEARCGILRSMFEDTLTKEQYNLSLNYDKKQTKDLLRGEAMLNNLDLNNLYKEVVEADALCTRLSGVKDSYSSAFSTISRIISLRISVGDQV